MRHALLVLFLSFFAAPAVAQEAAPEVSAADPADVESIDAIIAALYEVISGPAGERNWDRFRSLFASGAILLPMVPSPEGATPVRVLSPDDFVAWAEAYIAESAFYEAESGRTLERYGNIANAMSAYESRRDPAEEPFARGVNTITLVTDGQRWYVVSIAWDQEREGNPFPPEWLPAER